PDETVREWQRGALEAHIGGGDLRKDLWIDICERTPDPLPDYPDRSDRVLVSWDDDVGWGMGRATKEHGLYLLLAHGFLFKTNT
ncbi:MAG: hypothetical protein KDB96_17265, partial [Flavobacteriales bacterium]|nr:hypothetical protein [Flavobacteriales bacterium]